jgi:hypothetical protein
METEDDDMIKSQMDGKPYMASRVASNWRRALMKGELIEHARLLIYRASWFACVPAGVRRESGPSPIDASRPYPTRRLLADAGRSNGRRHAE